MLEHELSRLSSNAGHLSMIRCALLSLLIALPTLAFASDPTKPNIVILYADDLGFGDVQCYNPERGMIPTPHIDGLASQGMRFLDAHSSSGVCSPSRYTLLTGRYHWRTRLQTGIVGLWGGPVIQPERMTIGSLAQENGYATACIGKWHLGWNWPIPMAQKQYFKTTGYNGKKDLEASENHRIAWKDVFSKPITGGPTSVGFDQYFGTDVPNWPPYCFIENDRTLGIPNEFADPKLFIKNQASQQGPSIPGWRLEPILPTLAERACGYIEQQAETKTPFLLYLPLTSPHTPLSVNKQWIGRSKLNLYADFVMETDAAVGKVLSSIKECGLEKETLVIFTSDNGCAPYIGVTDLESKGHYPSGELRGYKADAWEGGHRVPFIVRWNGVAKAGSTCSQLVHQADLLATLADLMGTPLPDNAGEDSVSLIPLLRGETNPIRSTSISCSIRGVPSIRKDAWKYIPAPGSGGWGKGGDQSQPHQLYNLDEDLSESINLASKHPSKVRELQDLLESMITKGRSTEGQTQPNDVTVRRFRVSEPSR